MDFNKELDARGLNCPLPILKTKKALTDMAAGEVLKVVSTDAGSVKDMQAFAFEDAGEGEDVAHVVIHHQHPSADENALLVGAAGYAYHVARLGSMRGFLDGSQGSRG